MKEFSPSPFKNFYYGCYRPIFPPTPGRKNRFLLFTARMDMHLLFLLGTPGAFLKKVIPPNPLAKTFGFCLQRRLPFKEKHLFSFCEIPTSALCTSSELQAIKRQDPLKEIAVLFFSENDKPKSYEKNLRKKFGGTVLTRTVPPKKKVSEKGVGENLFKDFLPQKSPYLLYLGLAE